MRVAQIHHEKDCPGGETFDRRGTRDILRQCRGCGRFAPVLEQPDEPTEQTRPTRHAHLVCREHYAPVSFKGSGCKKCDKARRDAREGRRAKQTQTETPIEEMFRR